MPIEPDELLYRLIPVAQEWYRPENDPRPDSNAYRPQKYDSTGISLSRSRSDVHPEFLTAEQLAFSGRSPQGYYVAVLRAGDLLARGIVIEEDPVLHAADGANNPGHVVLPELNAGNRRSPQVAELTLVLADELTRKVLGPFPSARTQP